MEKDDKGSTMIRMGVSGWMFLLVPAYPGCPGSKAVKRSLLLLLFRQRYCLSFDWPLRVQRTNDFQYWQCDSWMMVFKLKHTTHGSTLLADIVIHQEWYDSQHDDPSWWLLIWWPTQVWHIRPCFAALRAKTSENSPGTDTANHTRWSW